MILDDKGLTVEEGLDAIEREVADIKIGPSSPQSPRVVVLEGLWKGLRVSKHDNAKAKRSLFKNASD